ncbi:MAG TPA: dTMP kinase [Thermotogota bacterium]|nr:dTMP kinase [Thermotogota bacterium]HRW92668.1 dTMP kinase [Thermotogota bacterium]
MPGSLVSFEGIDGCGKSTQVALLETYLRSIEVPVAVFREPGGTEVGEKIREVLLHPGSIISKHAEVLLYLSSRAQLTAQKILPYLEHDYVVLLDRFADSSVAYQGYGRGLPVETIIQMNSFAIQNRYPDLTFLLKISVDASGERLSGRVPDRLEGEGNDFKGKVGEGYEMLARRFSGRFVTIDGEKPPQQVHQKILKELRDRKLFSIPGVRG